MYVTTEGTFRVTRLARGRAGITQYSPGRVPTVQHNYCYPCHYHYSMRPYTISPDELSGQRSNVYLAVEVPPNLVQGRWQALGRPENNLQAD